MDSGCRWEETGKVSTKKILQIFYSELWFRWIESFIAAAPVDGKLTGSQAKHIMMSSKLPNSVLSKVWSLADVDRDGQLDEEEFCLAMYLIDYKVSGNDLPSILPDHLIPASKIIREDPAENTAQISENEEVPKTEETIVEK